MSEVNRYNATDWDSFVLAHGGNFLQSWGWGEFQKALGRQVARISLEKNDEGASSTVQLLAITHELRFGVRYVSIPRGPIFSGEPDATALRTVVLDVMAREHAQFAKLEFPFLHDTQKDFVATLVRTGFLRGSHREPVDTTIVNLAENESALLACMHPKTRYNIHVAERHGVTVREVVCKDDEQIAGEVEKFWDILSETANRDNFSTHPQQYYETMMQVFGVTEKGLRVRLVFAELDGEVLAGGVFAEYGDTLTYLHGASRSDHREYMAPYALHWRVMLSAKSRGCTKYDLWGVAPADQPTHPWAGISRFKHGFGGTRAQYEGAWELPRSRFWHTVYTLAKKARG